MTKNKLHMGTKLVKLTDMSLGEYNEYRGWELPADEDPGKLGYLVEYLSGGGANHPNHSNYISWSPKQVADDAYYPVDGMSFGIAIEMAKEGYKIARKGWNGKGMWVIYVPGTENAKLAPGTPYEKALNTNGSGQTHCMILPHLDMYTVDYSGRRAFLPGWSASQSDTLATDWVLVE